MALKLPRLPASQRLVNEDGTPTIVFSTWWQAMATQLESVVNSILAIPEIQTALTTLDTSVAAATAAAAAANTAAATATAASAATTSENALVNSTITPTSVLTASPTTITIASHTRNYADGTSVSVTGGTIAATASGDTDYVSYSDPTRAGGAVTYIVSTTPPAQTGNIHVVGAVTIPASGTVSGGHGPVPGFVSP